MTDVGMLELVDKDFKTAYIYIYIYIQEGYLIFALDNLETTWSTVSVLLQEQLWIYSNIQKVTQWNLKSLKKAFSLEDLVTVVSNNPTLP